MSAAGWDARRTRRRRPWVRALVVAALLVLAFLLGIAFSRTLDERPQEGDLVTTVQTLESLPTTERTVTVTVTAP